MARVLGEAARYVTEHSIKKYRMQFLALFLAAYCFALVLGLLIGLGISKQPYSLVMFLIFIAAIPFLVRLTNRTIERLERERINFRKGATGEAVVGHILKWFPDDYRVIHGLKPKPQYGDIDHIVVGPSGVFAIDTKNWKGIVTADGKGELLLNGKPQKPVVKNLTRTIMSIKENIRFLSSFDPYIQGVLVFPSAWVDAKWGTTGAVYCVRDERLYDYIVENKKRLSKKEIESIAQAFLALTREG